MIDTKVKEYVRVYVVPLVATILALILWYYHGNGEYLWFLILIGIILVLNGWGYIANIKKSNYLREEVKK